MKCTCKLQDLLNHGCKCGAFQNEHSNFISKFNKVQIFAMCECDWVAAHTEEDAVELYLEYTGMSLEEYGNYINEGYPYALDDMQMKQLNFFEDYDNIKTFSEKLQEMIDDNIDFPAFFASTEY